MKNRWNERSDRLMGPAYLNIRWSNCDSDGMAISTYKEDHRHQQHPVDDLALVGRGA